MVHLDVGSSRKPSTNRSAFAYKQGGVQEDFLPWGRCQAARQHYEAQAIDEIADAHPAMIGARSERPQWVEADTRKFSVIASEAGQSSFLFSLDCRVAALLAMTGGDDLHFCSPAQAGVQAAEP